MKQLYLSSVAMICLAGGVAMAQDATTATSASKGKIEDVVVTAQKRTQTAQKTAIPLTVFTGKQLNAEAKHGLDQILKQVPSLQIQASPQGADIVLRGVGGNDVGNNADPDVTISVDGVYNGQSSQVMGSIFDVSRIEVLVGPQGTLAGRNAAGGAVNINSNDPVINKYGAGINFGVGNLDLIHADGYLNVPINDVLALRVAGDRDSRNGYYTNGAGQEDNTAGRIKLKYKPNADLSVVGKFEYWNQRGYTETTVANPAAASQTSCGGPPCAFFVSTNPKNPWETGVFALPASVPAPNFNVLPVGNNNHTYTYELQADYDLGFGTVTLIPSMAREVSIQNSASLFAPSTPPITWNANSSTQYTGEARISSPASQAWKWVAGVYVLENVPKVVTAAASSAAGGTYTGFYNYAQANSNPPTVSVAGYAQTTYPVTSKLRLTLGGRYSVDNKATTWGVCSVTEADQTHCDGIYTSGVENLKASYNSFTPNGGIEYDITPTAMGYASITTGYKAGGFSTATTKPTTYAPENLTDYQLGLKSRWLDNRLEFNSDVYYYQYHNQQIELHEYSDLTDLFPAQYADLIAPGLDQLEITDVNAGNSKYYGFEEQTRYNVTDNDQITIDAAWEQANYGTFIIPISGAPPGGGYSASSYDLSGHTEAHVPKWSGTVGYQHIFDLDIGTITFRSSTRWQTKTFNTIQEWFANGNTVQGAYHQTDLYLNYASINGHWTAGLWVKNLENNAVVTSTYPLWKETLDEPRTYGATVGYSF